MTRQRSETVSKAVSSESASATIPRRARTAPQAAKAAEVLRHFAGYFAKPAGAATREAPPQDIPRFPFATGLVRSCCDVHFLVGQELRWLLRIVHHHAIDAIDAESNWIGANHRGSRCYHKCEGVSFCSASGMGHLTRGKQQRDALFKRDRGIRGHGQRKIAMGHFVIDGVYDAYLRSQRE